MSERASRRRASLPRDQAASPFNLILEELLDAVPFVAGAAIFDFEGETVDYAGEVDPFELKVAAATLQLVLIELRGCATLSTTREISITTSKVGYVIRILDESYGLLLIVRRLGAFALTHRLLDETEARIQAEAGLPIRQQPDWFRVDVEHAGRRPRRLRPIAPIGAGTFEAPWLDLEVLGSVVGLSRPLKGYRVRLGSGAEVTLLRESRRLWYVDMRIDVSSPALLESGTRGDVFRPGSRRVAAKLRD